MQAFIRHTGRVGALPMANVDTDQIVPKQFLKRLGRSGFGPALFFDWRYLADGSPNPEFELNRPEAAGATVLLAGPNFGCGSSREHAAWALAEYGFRAIIAPSFADIFYENCCQNGLLAVAFPGGDMDELFGRVAAASDGYDLTVDLERQWLGGSDGFERRFEIDPSRRAMLLQGLDAIGRTMADEADIAAFERRLVS